MNKHIESRLKELGIELQKENKPGGNYLPYSRTGSLVFISGQTPKWDGVLQYAGKIGKDYTIEEAKVAARLCGLNILLQIKNACDGDLDKVKRCVRIGVFLNTTDDFCDHAKVGNSVSDLMMDVFGENGGHARVSASSNSLPSGAAIEVDAIFEVEQYVNY